METTLKHQNYPFQGRDLYKKPEFYHYFDCLSPNFLSDYISHRENKIHELTVTSRAITSRSEQPIFQGNVNQLLKETVNELEGGSSLKFDRFCVKFETHRKFYNQYDRETLSPQKKSGVATICTYLTFAECLCFAYEQTKCLKYLSTLLKTNDCSCSVQTPTFFSDRLKYLLEQELIYVCNL